MHSLRLFSGVSSRPSRGSEVGGAMGVVDDSDGVELPLNDVDIIWLRVG